MARIPTRFQRLRRSLLFAAIASFVVGMLLYAVGQASTINPYHGYQTAAIGFGTAINVVAAVFWLVFIPCYLVDIRRSDKAEGEERAAIFAEAWLDRRRLKLLRGRSRRR